MELQVYTFSLDGKQITIDLTPYGMRGAGIGTRERAERAASLANELTYLKARVTSNHAWLRAQILKEIDTTTVTSDGRRGTKTAREERLHADWRYIASREVLDFVEGAWELMIRVHCPRLKDADSQANFAMRAGQGAQPPAFSHG